MTTRYRKFNNTIDKYPDLELLDISSNDYKTILARDCKYGVRSLSNKSFEGLNYTLGFELETIKGSIPEGEEYDLNCKTVHDGSLRGDDGSDPLGAEYVTGILTGDSGMMQLQKICTVLSAHCAINHKCGVHVHVGNIKFTNESLLMMYYLALQLESEIFELMPASRRENSYCRKLKDLRLNFDSLLETKSKLSRDIIVDELFEQFFKYVSHGHDINAGCNKNTNHPLGTKCGYNKETQRYSWLNFVHCVFATRGKADYKTLEFRNHSATLNFKKIYYWTKICIAFVNFVENHSESILKRVHYDKKGNSFPINLETIINAAYPKTADTLIEYVQKRKVLFNTTEGESTDYSTDRKDSKNLKIKEITCV